MSLAVALACVTHPARSARRRIQREHRGTVRAVDACADAVADAWDGPLATDRAAVVDPLRRRLAARGVLETLPRVLADAVDAAGFELPATPVPSPPYVAVTSRGPILRATVDPGRLVIRLDAFEVVRDPDPGYRRLDGVALSVALA